MNLKKIWYILSIENPLNYLWLEIMVYIIMIFNMTQFNNFLFKLIITGNSLFVSDLYLYSFNISYLF